MRILFIIPLVLVSLVSFSSWGDNPNLQDGMTAADSGDYTTALRHMIPLAEQGLSFAQDKLGYMYQYGIGVSLNIENIILLMMIVTMAINAGHQKKLNKKSKKTAPRTASCLSERNQRISASI